MEELKSPPPCPRTVTVRRNPHRKARATPSSTIPLPLPISSPSVSNVPSFPIQDILSIEVQEDKKRPDLSSSVEDPEKPSSESLKVFLRIRPLSVKNGIQKHGKYEGDDAKNAWPKNPKSKSGSKKKVKSRNETCLTVNDSHSVTVLPPQNLQDAKRVKSEVYEGFSRVFSAESSQIEVYDKMVKQLVEDFLNGKSGMLAALGPSGSGKTHTVFGCARNPGMVPLALRHIFSEFEGNGTPLARTFSLSIFEICSERGKSEKMYDLLREGVDLYLQQSNIKGLQEVMINDAQQAESLIACAMLKRATAMTNSNSQSSRSQCIINITHGLKKIDGDAEDEPSNAVLTIVDLAGAEREKKTGNQGLRLLESNFINNTSMVFGLCLRSLLEHQRNPRRPLQKHFQSSLLTRYLRAYLEGKKRMALVLTVKPGEEDYLDTSNLLKQASPYTQIKFTSFEESGNIKCSKRPIQTFPREEQLKRMKFCELEDLLIDKRQRHGDQLSREEMIAEKVDDANLTDIIVECEESLGSKLNGGVYPKNDDAGLARRDRECEITLNFAKALWNVLKQYKMKLEMAEKKICCLKDSLISEQRRCSDLENEVRDLKRQSSNMREASAEVSIIEFDEFGANHSTDIKGSQSTELQEGKFSSPAKASCIGAAAFNEQLSQHTGDQLECSHAHDNDDEVSSTAIEFGTEDAITNVGGVDMLIALQTCGNEKCEEADVIAGSGESLGHLEGIEEEPNSSISEANDALVLKDGKRNPMCREKESDHSACAVSFSQLSARSSTSEKAVCSSSSLVVSGNGNQLLEEEHEIAEKEICCLKDNLINEQRRCSDLENEVKDLERQSSNVWEASAKVSMIVFDEFGANHSPDIKGCQSTEFQEGKFSSPAKASCTGAIAFNEQLSLHSGDQIECACTYDNDDENSNTSIEFGAKDAVTNVGGSDVLIALQTCGNEECEEADMIANPGENLGHLKDIEEEHNSCIRRHANDALLLKNGKRTHTCQEKKESDHSECAVSFSQSFARSRISESAICSSSSLVVSGNGDNLPEEENEEVLDPLAAPKPEVDVSHAYVPEFADRCNPRSAAKPKRRLLPSSCVLLKDIGSLAVEDESDKPKGAKGEKKVAVDIRNKTKGSLSLLRLLRSDLHP